MTREMYNSELKKDGIIQTSPVVTMKILKDLPTWLKVATIIEKPPTPTHCKTRRNGILKLNTLL